MYCVQIHYASWFNETVKNFSEFIGVSEVINTVGTNLKNFDALVNALNYMLADSMKQFKTN